MRKPLHSLTFTRNPDVPITADDTATIDSAIRAGLATGILTNSTQIETNSILSLVFTYPEITRSTQRLAGLLQGSPSGHPPLYKLVEDREIPTKC